MTVIVQFPKNIVLKFDDVNVGSKVKLHVSVPGTIELHSWQELE